MPRGPSALHCDGAAVVSGFDMDAAYRQIGRWFALNSEERKLLGGILAIALIGLAARHLHLQRQVKAAAAPPPVAQPQHMETSGE